MSIPHVISAVFDRPWFITPGALEVMGRLVLQHDAGVTLSREDIRERLDVAAAASGPRSGTRVAGSVGVLPIYGSLFHRANLMTDFSGGATYQGITRAFRDAMADESIGSVVLEFDSPGGEVGGLEELAAEIRANRGRKPIIAHANTLMASAAYYLAAQADEIVAAPWALIGSIGTVVVHQETSRMDDAMGITTTIIRKPDAKYRGSSLEPLDDATREHMQSIVDGAYDQFVNAVAKGRGVTPAAVRAGYGKGEVLASADAKAAGLVDRIESLDDTIRRVASGRVKTGGPRNEGGDIEPGGVYLVGEQGPELLNMPKDGAVLPNASDAIAASDLDDDARTEAHAEALVAGDVTANDVRAAEAERAARLELDADAWRFRS